MKDIRVGFVGIVVAGLLVGTGCSSAGSETGAGSGKGATTRPAPTGSTTAPAASTVPEPLADQTPPSTINGLTLQGDTLWVASIEDDEVLQVDADSGAILRRIDTHGAGPDDVAVAPDGSVWTAGFANGDLGRIDPDGTYQVVHHIEVGLNPIEFGSDGMLYVGTSGKLGKLYALITDGGAPVAGFSPKAVVQWLPDINAFAVLDDGTLVAPAGGLTGPSGAVRIDPAKGTVTPIVTGLPAVAAGAADAHGVPYLLANITGEIIRIDVEAKTSEVVETVRKGVPFDNLAFAPDGTVYVSSFVDPTITVVAPDGVERVLSIGS
ncbi:MAG TPA: hypothetical protein VNQ33_10450 [Acidimicrobiales bacterium]|nr:hypothetical protein [Acidimicrobiales bacterium]